MTDVADSKMLVAKIKKVPGSNVFTNSFSTNEITPPIRLKQDYSISKYNFLPINSSQFNDKQICDNDFCCSISVGMRTIDVMEDAVSFR